MTAYIQSDHTGNYYNINAYTANEGFRTLGWETVKFTDADEITDPDPDPVVVGGIGNVRKRLRRLGIERKGGEIDYPPELEGFLGRKIWTTTLEAVFNDRASWGLFVKPKEETKKFAGKVFREYMDFVGLADPAAPTAVWCSEPVSFVAEWRCFIRYGEVLDVRNYKGAWDQRIDRAVVEAAVKAYRSAPAAYALDFGIDAEGVLKLVEVNDGHSLGTYGLTPVKYAKFLSARWAQLTGTKDYLHF